MVGKRWFFSGLIKNQINPSSIRCHASRLIFAVDNIFELGVIPSAGCALLGALVGHWLARRGRLLFAEGDGSKLLSIVCRADFTTMVHLAEQEGTLPPRSAYRLVSR